MAGEKRRRNSIRKPADAAGAESAGCSGFQLWLFASEEVRPGRQTAITTAEIALIAATPSAAAASFTCLVAVPAKHRAVAAWFKRNSRWLAAAGADYRCAMGRCRTIPGASPTLFALLCLTARLAALGGRITALLKERLISSCERKILSTITARKLNIAGHGSPMSAIVHSS